MIPISTDTQFRRAFARHDLEAMRALLSSVSQSALDDLAGACLGALRGASKEAERAFARSAFLLLAAAGAHHPDRKAA